MEIQTTFNSPLFSYETTIPGHNHSLKFPLALWTMATLTPCSLGIVSSAYVISIIAFSSLRTSVFMNLVTILAILDILNLLAVINIEKYF